ncbi:hypothetical protein O9X98_07415 [Agrobacterium salinitolerans]|nr:hypothetical protein [Agrobacterium salinitolerans]
MKIDIRYPLRFKALPPRCSGRKDVLVSFLHTATVPEISEREVSTVFETATETPYRLVEFGGKLFRRIGNTAEEAVKETLNQGFQHDESRNDLRYFTFENGKTPQRPLSQPLNNHICHRLYLEGDNRNKELEAWPFIPVITGFAGRRTSRNSFLFEDLERKLKDIDGEDFAKGRAEHVAEAAKLLVVDGDLWIETPPPAIAVKVDGYGSTARMVMELTHLPDWLDGNLDRQYFPLSEHEKALEYAARATKLTASGTEPLEDYTFEREIISSDSHLLSFDAENYSCTRTALVLGGDVARWLTYTEGLAEKVGGERARSVFLARDMAKAIGTDISEWPDMTDLIHDVTEAWKLTGRKPGWATIPQNRHAFGTMICERAADVGKISVFATLASENLPS